MVNIYFNNVISPIDGSVYARTELATANQARQKLKKAVEGQKEWAALSQNKRAQYIVKFLKAIMDMRQEIAEELTWQMGRPLQYTPFELDRLAERTQHMVAIAEDALAPLDYGEKDGAHRYISRDPLGVVLVIAPWNYPYITAVNVIVPALMAGNAVILKHSGQTPKVADRYAMAFEAAEIPRGVFQVLHADHHLTEEIIKSDEIDFVSFTGSVKGGVAVSEAAAPRFIGTGLELGGKDPAYIRADAPMQFTAENVIDGILFNSGQSCCGIERVYVHEDVYDDFVEALVAEARKWKLGNPLDLDTMLGPMIRAEAADFVRGQIEGAKSEGAQLLLEHSGFELDKPESPYLGPQLLTDVTHRMRIMRQESFGPVAGIMKVKSDEQAIELMNDSEYGLTASIWTEDLEAGHMIGKQVKTGTLFVNRCDYLDPALCWTGIKNTGRGASLSVLGYHQLTRPKSYYLRKAS